MRNHISLMVGYMNRLFQLSATQHLIDSARAMYPTNQLMQLELDRRQTEVIDETTRIHDEMFEIARNN